MAIDGGPGEPRVIHVYHTISSGRSYTRRERRGNTIYIHHYRLVRPPQHPDGRAQPGAPGGGGGGGAPSRHPDGRAQPGAPSGRGGGGGQRANAGVIARQRLLRTLGYSVRVDGIWGPQSQRHWASYLGRGGSTSTASQADEQRREYRDLQRRQRQSQARIHRQQTKAAAGVQRALAITERNRTGLGRSYADRPDKMRWDRIEGSTERRVTRDEKKANRQARNRQFTQAIVERRNLHTALRLNRLGTILGEDERSAKRMSLQDIVLLSTHGLDVSQPRGARVVQRWLKANGEPDLKVDGKFGPETANAMAGAWRKAVARESRKQIRLVVNAFYESGILQVGGDRPEWWPFKGKIPTPEALRDLLQEGGFGSSLIWATLHREMRNPHTEYLMWRAQDIRRTADALYGQFGPSGDLAALERLGIREPDNLLAMRVYGTQVGLIQDDPLLDDAQEGLSLARLRARWQAIASSQTIDQFERNLKALEFEEEQAYLAEMKERAESLPWWADVLHEISRPGEWLRVNLIAQVKWAGDDPRGWLGQIVGVDEDSWLVENGILDVTSQADITSYMSMAEEEIQDSPWAVRIAYELLVDPINLIPLGGWAASGARVSMKGLTFTGRTTTRISETAPLVGSEYGIALARVGEGIETLGLNALWLPQGARLAKAGVLGIPGVGKVISKSGTMKLEAQRRMRATAEQASRLRFKKVDGKYADLRYADDVTPKNPKTLALLDETEGEMKRHLHIALRQFVSGLNREDVALYASHAREDFSTVGGMLRGYAHEVARTISTRRLADRFAKDKREAFIKSLDDPDVLKQWSSKRFPKGITASRLDQEIQRVAGVNYQEEYNRILRSIGVYLKGTADEELDDLLYQQVFAIAKQFEDHVMVHLQTMLEEMAEQGGKELWDEAGRWIGRGGELETRLRNLVKASFDDEVLIELGNPMYAKVLTAERAENRMQSEIRRAHARYLGWVARKRSEHLKGYDADGEPIYDGLPDSTLPENVDKKLESLEEEIRAQWVRVNQESYRFRLNEETLNTLRAELNLPHVPIELRVVKSDVWDTDFAGKYVHDRRIIVNIPEAAVMADGGKAALAWRKRISQTVAHEHRHAFQWDTLGQKGMDEGMKGDYWWQAVEVDARKFAAEVKHRLREMVEFERVPAGSYINVQETVKVSPIYARDQADAFFEYVPQGNLDVLAAPATVDDPMAQEIHDLIWALGNSPKQGDIVAPNDVTQRSGGKTRPGVKQRGIYNDDPPLQFDQEALRLAVFKDEIAVSRAWDEVMARLSYRNLALMQALSHSESFAGRRTYGAIKGMLDVWVTSTLPLRTFGWMLRNIVDNFVKIFIAGVRDPRAWFLGGKTPGAGLAGRGVKSVFDLGAREVVESARMMDGLFGTNVAEQLEDLLDAFWLQSSALIGKVFKAHGVPVADDVLEQMSFRPWEMPQRSGSDVGHLKRKIDKLIEDGDEAGWMKLADEPEFAPGYRKPEGWMERFRDKAWDLFASRPENYFRRALYRDTFYKERARLLKQGIDPITADRQAMKVGWERVEDVLFDYSQETVLEENLKFFFPFLQFWRKNSRFWIETAVKKPWVPYDLARMEAEVQELNEDLPSWARRYIALEPVSSLIAKVPGFDWLASYIESLGFENLVTDPMNYLSAAPLWRAFKDENPNLPGESAGLPFVGPFLDAMSDWGLTLNPFIRKPLESLGIVSTRSWQSVFPQVPLASAFTRKYFSENIADYILDLEYVFTFFQGDTPSEAVAENFNLYVQQEMANQVARGESISREKAEGMVRGYIWLQTLIGYTTGVYARKLSPEDIYSYKLHESVWRGEKFFSDLTDEEKKLVEVWKRRKLPQADFDRYVDAIPYIQAFYNQPDFDARQAYKQKNPQVIPYVEPAWRGEQWTSNYVGQQALSIDTDAAMKMFKLAEGLKLDPETTKLAETLLVTNELREYWAQNDTAKDIREKQMRGLYHRRLWALNQTFFAIPDKDYEAKDGFLAEHPELRDWWNLNNEPSDDYAAVLNAAYTDLRQRYFEFADAQDWDAANAFLKQFPFIFDRIKDGKYVKDRSTGRPDGRSQSQHSRDYLAAKVHLDYYFSLSASARRIWLKSGSAGAKIVLDYFKKYGDNHRASGGFGSRGDFVDWEEMGFLKAHNAELSLRLRFWQKYFSLAPDKRAKFVENHADDYGIFIYGILTIGVLAQQEAEWLRQAFAAGMSDKAAHYLYVKPLLDFFFTLPHDQRKLFLRANPELQDYFNKYTNASPSGDPKLDKLIERYFKLAPDSPQRSRFLKDHPEVQRYFDSRSTPAEQALHRRLEQYFQITNPLERKEFLIRHPEIQDYFDKKARERDMEQMALSVFTRSDPRFAPFLSAVSEDITGGAQRMLERLNREKSAGPLGVRRERKPLGG